MSHLRYVCRPEDELEKSHKLLSINALKAHGVDSEYIGDGVDNTVKRFDARTGAYRGAFVVSGRGGLLGPRGLIFTRGSLYVANQNAGQTFDGEILQYRRTTGDFLSALVPCNPPGWACAANGPFAPRGLIRGLGNTLYVADLGNFGTPPDMVPQFDIKTGTFLGDLDITGFTGGFYPRGIVLGPDDLLYVSVVGNLAAGDVLTGYVLRFNPHSGRFVDIFTSNLAAGCAAHLHRPEGLVFGPDGDLYITAFRADPSDTDKILIFDGITRACLNKIDLDQVGQPRAFAQAILFGPGGFLFVPINGNGPDTGAVRRYDVTNSSFPFTNFVSPSAQEGPLGQPWYLTFEDTNPKTLEYGD